MGLLTDFLLLFFMGRWCIKGGSWRFMIGLVLTLALKSYFSSWFMMSPPPGDLWHYPGFYSLTVPYGRSNDYHYNTVLAITIMLALEYHNLKYFSLMWLAIICMLGNAYLTTALRGHYFIDNFGGLCAGYYFWTISNNWLSYYIDVKLFGMTLHERNQNIPLECFKCSEPINQWTNLDKTNKYQSKLK